MKSHTSPVTWDRGEAHSPGGSGRSPAKAVSGDATGEPYAAAAVLVAAPVELGHAPTVHGPASSGSGAASAGRDPSGSGGSARSAPGASPLIDMSLAMLLVGATAPLGELALAGMPLFPVLALRLALAGAALCLVSSTETVRLNLRHRFVLAIQAFCGVVVFNAGMWLGMADGGPASAGVFASAAPAVMALLGWALFRERLSGRTLAGVGLATCGVMAARGAWSGGWDPGIGDIYLAVAVLGECVFLLALKWLPVRLAPVDAARRVTWAGFWMVLPLAAWQGWDWNWGAATWTSWAAVAALGLLVTAGGYVLWFRGVARAGAGQAAAVTGLLPVSAVLSSWMLLGDAPTAGQVSGCLAVGAGIWLASRRDQPAA